MSDKPIPNSDTKFREMADTFARIIAKDPDRFNVSREDAEALSEAVVAYQRAAMAAFGGARSPSTTLAKNEAREKARKLVQRLRNRIRHDDTIDPAARALLSLPERTTKARHVSCPAEPPRLRFVRALHESGATPMHELEFAEFETMAPRKPAGAVRIELFVDLVPPDEPIPAHPGANHGGRPWYLRSYTRNPIIIAPPMTRVPMRVVYWGRWADSLGNVGPFSATAAAWIEGGSHQLLPGGMGMGGFDIGAPQLPQLMDDETPVGPAGRDSHYSVVILDARCQWLTPTLGPAPALPAPSAPPKQRQLEGPAMGEAA